MNITTKRILIGSSVLLITLFGYIIYGLYLMSIEDRYGSLELYDNAKDGNLIIIDNKEAGFIKRYDGEIFVVKGDCMKHILNLRPQKFEIYEFSPEETYPYFTIKEALEIKAKPTTKLVYKGL